MHEVCVHLCQILHENERQHTIIDDRASFDATWREQPQQQYGEATQRIALHRRHAPDDQFADPRNM